MKDLFELIANEDMTFTQAVEYFKGKLKLTPKEFYKLADKYKSLAFTVSNYSKAEIINQFYETLLAAIEEGTTLNQFKEDMNSFLKDKGYKGITQYQAKNIFLTNIQTAYNVGHYENMTSPEVMKHRPYWQYDAVNDDRTRPSHRAMHGRVFPADSSVWDVWYPPNGFGCRCGVISLSERQVKERELMVEYEKPTIGEVDGFTVNINPDPHFNTNPAKVRWEPDISKYPEALKKAYNAQNKNEAQN